MPGWSSGCDTNIGGEIYSEAYSRVEGFKNVTEFDLFNANGLIKPLEKLINFDTVELKKY